MASWRDKGAGSSSSSTSSSGGWRSKAPKAQVGTGIDFETASGEAPYTAKLDENKKAAAQQILRLQQSGFIDNGLRAKVATIFRPEEMELYGLQDFDTTPKESKFQKAMQLGNTATGGGLFKTLEILDAPRTVGVAGYRQANYGVMKAANKAGLVEDESLAHLKGGWDQFREDLGSHVGMGDVWQNIRETQLIEDEGGPAVMVPGAHELAKPGRLGDYAAKGVGFTGDVALDPLAYVGGSSAATKATQKSLTRAGYGAAVTKIKVHGLDGALKKGLITEAEHAGMREVMRETASELVDHAIEGGHKRALTRSGRARNALAEAGDVEGLAARSEMLLRTQGRAGVKVGVGDTKRVILPTYIKGKGVLTTRKYGANIMGGKAAAEAASEAPIDQAAVD